MTILGGRVCEECWKRLDKNLTPVDKNSGRGSKGMGWGENWVEGSYGKGEMGKGHL